MSEAMAAPECDHFYVSHLHRGMYVRVCNLCNQPDWGDLTQQFAAVRTEERAAQGERTSQLVEAMIAAESFTHDPFEDPVEVVPVEFVRQAVADGREAAT